MVDSDSCTLLGALGELCACEVSGAVRALGPPQLAAECRCVHLGTFGVLCDCDISNALGALGASRVSGAFDSTGAKNSPSVLGGFGVSGTFVL